MVKIVKHMRKTSEHRDLVDLAVRQATTSKMPKTDRPKNEDVPHQKLACFCFES